MWLRNVRRPDRIVCLLDVRLLHDAAADVLALEVLCSHLDGPLDVGSAGEDTRLHPECGDWPADLCGKECRFNTGVHRKIVLADNHGFIDDNRFMQDGGLQAQ